MGADSWRSYDWEWLCLSSCALEKALSWSEKAFFKVCSYPEEMGISLKASMDKKTVCLAVRSSQDCVMIYLRLGDLWLIV